MTTISFTDEEFEQLAICARKEKLSVNEYVNMLYQRILKMEELRKSASDIMKSSRELKRVGLDRKSIQRLHNTARMMRMMADYYEGNISKRDVKKFLKRSKRKFGLI